MSQVGGGHGILVSGLGSFARSGGGISAWSAARAYAVAQGARLAVLVPVKKAKRWWSQQGFVPIPEIGKLRRHASHHCHVAGRARDGLQRLRPEAEQRDISFEAFAATLYNAGGYTDPYLLWLD